MNQFEYESIGNCEHCGSEKVIDLDGEIGACLECGYEFYTEAEQ